MSNIFAVSIIVFILIVLCLGYYIINRYDEIINGLKDNTKRIILLICAFVLCVLFGVCYVIGLNHERNKTVDYEEIKMPSSIDKEDFPLHYIEDVDMNVPTEYNYILNLNDYSEEMLINTGGVYELSGSFEGRIVVDAKDELINLVLNNASIKSVNGPAVIVENASKVVFSTLDNTQNTISDSGYFKKTGDYVSCIESNANITFNGLGTLSIYGLFKDAIRTNDVVKIVSGTVNVESKRTAIHGTDGINISGGNTYLATQKYALKTTKNSSGHKGAIIVSGGELNIIAGRYSFVSDSDIYVFNSSITEKTVSRFNVAGNKYVDEDCFK